MSDQEIVPGFSAEEYANNDTHYSPGLEGEEQPPQQELEQSEQVAQRTHRPKKKKAPAQYKIDRLIYENDAKEQEKAFWQMQAAESQNVASYQNQKIQELEQRLQAKEQNEGSNYITALDSEQRRIKGELKRAKEDGNVDAEIELVDQLAEIKSRKNSYDVYKVNQAENQHYQMQNEAYVPLETYLPNVAPQSAPVDPEFQDWLSENGWYAHNPQLRNEADAIASDLSNRLSFNNQAHLIGTPEFRDSVTRLMNDRYGVQGSGQQESSEQYEQEQPVQQSTARYQYNVSPVTRRGGSMADDYLNSNPRSGQYVPLTKEEYQMARHLPNRGGTMRETDLVREYQKAKSYPKSPLPGGTQWRLTII